MFFCIRNINLNAQEKYAGLITGDYAVSPGEGIPDSMLWNDGVIEDTVWGLDEFWNDTYLVWEMLVYEKGFNDENVFILFADGIDPQNIQGITIANRYNPTITHFIYSITDYPATYDSLVYVFERLADGEDGFPQITDKDLLFVWTFDHGGYNPSSGKSYLCLIGEEPNTIFDNEFAYYMDQIPAAKKVYWMQQCFSGGFADDLEKMNSYFHSACGMETAGRADDNWDIENEEYPNNPDTIVCHHGEFNFHTYSPMVGESPDYKNYYGEPPYPQEPYSSADLNNDGLISFYETYVWEEGHETKNEEPVLSDIGNIGPYTTLEYPNIIHGNVQNPLLQFNGEVYVTKDVYIKNGSTVRLVQGSELRFLGDHKIVIEEGGTLKLEDSTQFIANNSNNFIKIEGSLVCGNHLTFENLAGNRWNGLVFDAPQNQATLNEAILHDCNITGKVLEIDITNCTFNNSNVDLSFHREEPEGSHVTVTNCAFNGSSTEGPAIAIELYSSFELEGNNIQNFMGNAIELYNSGHDATLKHLITENTIHYNGSNPAHTGILVYNSCVSIHNNLEISYNPTGLKFLNRSQVSLRGNQEASVPSQTQQIMSNIGQQIYASFNSFPYEFKYNAVYNGSPSDYLVYYNTSSDYPVDVTHNYWGEEFNPQQAFYPYGLFNYEPVWDLSPFGVPTEPGLMYNDAQQSITNQQYTTAETTLKSLVETYPGSKFAKASIKTLFDLYYALNKNFNVLKNYLDAQPAIQNNVDLKQLASFVSNRCDIALENYQPAIMYYEDIIQNPPTFEDSIFAIIDLEDLYIQIGDNKTGYSSKLPQFIPASKEIQEKHRDKLLALIGKEEKPSDLQHLTKHLSDANVPGKETIQLTQGNNEIHIELKTMLTMQVTLYNIYGKKVYHNTITKPAGTHKLSFSQSGLKPGMYICKIFINDTQKINKKIMIID